MPATVIQRYKPQGVLGIGPLGKVYTAIEADTGRKVAFRAFMKPEDADPDHWAQAIARFNKELTAARALDHPNIAKLFEFGEQDGVYFVVSEWFDGVALAKLTEGGKRVEYNKALNLIGQAGRAIEFAASTGSFHSDVTPFNIVVDKGGTAHVVNYGLGHCRPKEDSLYRSPEELLGYSPSGAADLFCLGLVLFELLEGKHPFAAATPKEVQNAIIWNPAPAITAGPEYLQMVVRKLLAKRPEDRYQSWGEVALDIVNGRAPAAAPKREWDTSPAPCPNPMDSPNLAQYRKLTDALREKKKREAKREAAFVKVRGYGSKVWKVALAGVAVLLVGHGIFARASENSASLDRISGSVQVERTTTGKRATHGATAGQSLQVGDVIRTGDGATARLSLGDGTRILLAPKTALDIREIGSRPGAARARSFFLWSGSVVARVRPRPNQKFAIGTPFGTATAKGTQYAVTLGGSGMAVQTLTGVVATKGTGKSVDVPGGKQVFVAQGTDPGKPAPLMKGDLTDLMKAIEKLADTGLLAEIGSVLGFAEDLTVTRIGDAVASVGDMMSKGRLKEGSARARGLIAMQALVKALDAGATEGSYPDSLNPTTLSEIGADDEMRERILGNLKDRKLEYYKKLRTGYEVGARIDDEQGALIVARNGKVTIKSDE
jgi:eukaryotic-like serine/threonine-protein kinase